VIRGIDITQLITTGDQSSLIPRGSIGDGAHTLKTIDSALSSNPLEKISKYEETVARKYLTGTMDSVYSRNLKADGTNPSSTVSSGDSISNSKDKLSKFMTINKYGKASSILVAVGEVVGISKSSLGCSGFVGNHVHSLTVGTMGFINTQEKDSMQYYGVVLTSIIQSDTISIVDYRWASDYVSDPWYNYASPTAFTSSKGGRSVSWGDLVWLALRLKIPAGVEITQNSWNLYFRIEGAGSNSDVPWTSVTAGGIFSLISNPETSNRLPDGYNSSKNTINYAHRVTRESLSNPNNISSIKIAVPGSESLSSVGPLAAESELEVWYPLALIDPAYSLDQDSKVYFKLESLSLSTDGVGIESGNTNTRSYWWSNAVS